MFKLKFNTIAFLMVCIYLVGVVGHLFIDLKPLFLWLTPFNLVLTLFIFLLLNAIKVKDFIVISIIFLIGFFVEVIGVKTGILFGSYQYGESLGFKWLEVPLVIGLNWVLLNLAGFGLTHKYIKNVILKSAIASLLIVWLDVLIEPVAIQIDYWSWAGDIIPFQNYLMWFGVSFVIQLLINYSNLKINFKSSLLIILLQVLFFTILNLAL
jgi:putative membrane protein